MQERINTFLRHVLFSDSTVQCGESGFEVLVNINFVDRFLPDKNYIYTFIWSVFLVTK